MYLLLITLIHTYITCSVDIFLNKESEENKASQEERKKKVVGPNAVKVFDILINVT
jgi:hypothetical protein